MGLEDRRWTEQEEEILREHYPSGTKAELEAMLPGRSMRALHNRASALGIRRAAGVRMGGMSEAQSGLKRPRWSTDDLMWLIENYHAASPEAIRGRFPDRSENAIRCVARKLGITRSAEMTRLAMSESHARAWDGKRADRTERKDGYVYVRKPGHPKADKYGWVREHVLVWEEANGGPLPEGHMLHHRNGRKNDNRPENLELLPPRKHAARHVKGEAESLADRERDAMHEAHGVDAEGDG